MLCDDCGQLASFHLTRMEAGAAVTERTLCEACARSRGADTTLLVPVKETPSAPPPEPEPAPTRYHQGLTRLDVSRAAARAERDLVEGLMVKLRAAAEALPQVGAEPHDPFARPKAALALVEGVLLPGLEEVKQARIAAKAARDAVYQE